MSKNNNTVLSLHPTGLSDEFAKYDGEAIADTGVTALVVDLEDLLGAGLHDKVITDAKNYEDKARIVAINGPVLAKIHAAIDVNNPFSKKPVVSRPTDKKNLIISSFSRGNKELEETLAQYSLSMILDLPLETLVGVLPSPQDKYYREIMENLLRKIKAELDEIDRSWVEGMKDGTISPDEEFPGDFKDYYNSLCNTRTALTKYYDIAGIVLIPKEERGGEVNGSTKVGKTNNR